MMAALILIARETHRRSGAGSGTAAAAAWANSTAGRVAPTLAAAPRAVQMSVYLEMMNSTIS